jgi:ATP-dependent RNA helicase DDX18/HAS1
MSGSTRKRGRSPAGGAGEKRVRTESGGSRDRSASAGKKSGKKSGKKDAKKEAGKGSKKSEKKDKTGRRRSSSAKNDSDDDGDDDNSDNNKDGGDDGDGDASSASSAAGSKKSRAAASEKSSSANPNSNATKGQEKDAQTAKGGSNILTDKGFDDFELADQTREALKDMGFTHCTRIQAESIQPLLEGRDLLGAARTGSGKTLAFVIPAVELLRRVRFLPRNGTGVVIISPTRELALQIYGVVREICKYHNMTHGIVMGGANRRAESDRLQKGVCILVATPGRLLDHLTNTTGFVVKNLQALVIDEADRLLEQGFELEMKEIIKRLPADRQSMLFSATQTRNVEDLARLTLRENPVYVGVDDSRETSTVAGLEQGYLVVPSEKRLLLLFTFLKKNRKRKVIVFFSSCMSVKFHAELFNYINLPVMELHGRQKQLQRSSTFFSFVNAESGILFCTDVAARGLDIPAVDWIIQYDPPDEPASYIHRVGRTARGQDGRGHALIFLCPEELGFLKYLRQAKVPLNEYEFDFSKLAAIQSQLEKLVSTNYFLNSSAKAGYKGYVSAYASHALKDVFNVHALDLARVALSFGFSVPPRVDLKLSARGGRGGDQGGWGRQKKPGNKYTRDGGSGAFSAENPYGKRAAGDKRQFQR